MTDITTAAPPLTRRQAREIERRTGKRPIALPASATAAPVAHTAPAAPTADIHDTARIEPNDKLALVSVLPTEVIDRVAATPKAGAAPALATESAFARSASVRAPRPAALVARARRRSAVGLGVAASAAVLATTGIAVPGVVSAQQDAAQASLVSGDDVAQEEAGVPDAQTATAPAPMVDLVAAPETAPDRSDLAVTSFSPEAVEEAVIETASTAADGASAGGADVSGLGAIAESMVGGGAGWLCTEFTAAVYAEIGIELPGLLVSSQAAGGTQTSNPQVGDLVIFNSGHIGIYAGGGMMWDNPGYASPTVGWQNVYRSMDVIGSGYYFVTYR